MYIQLISSVCLPWGLNIQNFSNLFWIDTNSLGFHWIYISSWGIIDVLKILRFLLWKGMTINLCHYFLNVIFHKLIPYLLFYIHIKYSFFTLSLNWIVFLISNCNFASTVYKKAVEFVYQPCILWYCYNL